MKILAIAGPPRFFCAKFRTRLAHLCEVPRERFVVLERLQLVAVGQTVLGEIHEAIVVLTQHPDVYIVIPRNESAVTRRPEKRSRVHKP